MCLVRLVPKGVPAKKGWKIFQKDEAGISGLYYNTDYGFYYDIGKWIKDTKQGLLRTMIYNERYAQGFHVFHTKEDAESYNSIHGGQNSVILSVLIKDPVAVGTSEETIEDFRDALTTVCKQIKILKDKQ